MPEHQPVWQIDFLIPVKTVSEMNQREHWRVRYDRKVAQQQELAVAWHNNLKGRIVRLPCSVRLTRIGPRALDDDNLRGAMKFLRDAIAFKLGVDDGDPRAEWEYKQMPVGVRQYAVKVEIRPRFDGE